MVFERDYFNILFKDFLENNKDCRFTTNLIELKKVCGKCGKTRFAEVVSNSRNI